MKNEKPYLQHCLSLIEQKTGWGSPDHWTHQDFICLGDLIQEETGIHLSSTTLKRVWGKVKYDSFPHTTTLNTLARYAGYDHWRALVTAQQQLQRLDTTEKHEASQEYEQDRKHIARAAAILLLFIVGVFALLGTVFSTDHTPAGIAVAASKDFSFSAHPIATGLPNTVVFRYDATAAVDRPVSIQSAEDTQAQTYVAADKHQHTALYYYPGVYQTKLLVNSQVVKEQEVMIKTKGWLAMIEQPVPLYFTENLMQQGMLSLPSEALCSDTQTSIPWTAYYNVGNFGALSGNDFTLETELKSNFNKGEAVCQDTSVVILRSRAPSIIIPLTIPGCLAKVDQQLKGSVMQDGKLDLTAFGCNLSDWVQVKCEAKDGQFRLWVNRKLAYEGTLPQDNSQIAGILYRFHGNGSVRNLRLGKAGGKVIYEEDFAG